MEGGVVLQGRSLSADDIGFIRQLIADHPGWHRTRLSQELCRCWEWTNASGQFKDMAARAVLRKLDARSLITLPPPVRSANNAYRHRGVVSVALDQSPISARLDALRPIRILPVQERSHAQLFRALLAAHHYLGYSGPVGENLQYLVFDRDARVLGCLLFGAAAWRVACRERFIGWTPTARQSALSRIANNMRFLILPWVRVAHLASHLLAGVSRRLSGDWTMKYGHPIELLETFVETARFEGTCYAAANWIPVGVTTGRSRNDRHTSLQVPRKAVWLYPLSKHFRTRLGAPGGVQ
jgi:hypothetical protein